MLIVSKISKWIWLKINLKMVNTNRLRHNPIKPAKTTWVHWPISFLDLKTTLVIWITIYLATKNKTLRVLTKLPLKSSKILQSTHSRTSIKVLAQLRIDHIKARYSQLSTDLTTVNSCLCRTNLLFQRWNRKNRKLTSSHSEPRLTPQAAKKFSIKKATMQALSRPKRRKRRRSRRWAH